MSGHTEAELSRAVEEAIAETIQILHQHYPGIPGEKLADRLAMRAMQMIGADAGDVQQLVRKARYHRQFGMAGELRKRWMRPPRSVLALGNSKVAGRGVEE